MSQARVVNCGVDTLVVNVYYTDLGHPFRRDIDWQLVVQLDGWKRTAQE